MLSDELLANIELVVFDFDGVFTDNTVYFDQNGVETVRCWRSDGLGLARLQQAGVKIFIVSTEVNSVVSMRAKKLGIKCIQGVEDKASGVLAVCRELHIDPNKTMFVGNDINDIPAFQLIRFPVGVADSYPEIYPYIIYRTKKPGGFGAVREICDLVCNAKKNNSEHS